MKRLLIPLLTALALPTAINAEQNIFYSKKEDLMTDVIKVNIDLLSETTVLNSIGAQAKARIGIRCKGSELNTYIKTPTYNANNLQVQLRFDKNQPKKESWTGSVDGTSFFPEKNNQKDHRSFIRNIRNHDSLVFGWSPYSTGAKAVKFDLTKINPKIDQAIIDGCIFEEYNFYSEEEVPKYKSIFE